jgi:hypothetical protein
MKAAFGRSGASTVMKAILTFIGFGILAANLAAIGFGTRRGIGGMLTIDVLSAVLVCFIGAIWLGRRMIRPAQGLRRKGNELNEHVTKIFVGEIARQAENALLSKRSLDDAIARRSTKETFRHLGHATAVQTNYVFLRIWR